jgi:hypothetical protein
MPVRNLLTIHRPMKILKKDPPDISFNSANLSNFYFPGRGFIASLVLHVTVFTGFVFIPLLWLYLFPPPGPERVVFIELNEPTTVMYLPPLQSGKQTAAAPEREEKDENQNPAPPPAFDGLTYPGPQPILSDPSDPTNDIQTILQPEIENPPILEPPQPVPNILQTETTPPLVQKPSEPILKMDLEPLERMDFSDRALISPDLPAEGLNPETQFPDAEMPDLIKTDAEPEMVLPDSELTPIERMNPSDQDPASTASPLLNSAQNRDFPAAQLPGLIRSAPGSETPLLESELTPLERINSSDQDPASTASPPLNSAQNRDFPAAQLPGLIRSTPGSEMKLPESKFIPRQRMDPSKRAIAPTLTPPSGPNSGTGFPATRIPGQMRSAGESETPLLDSQLTPIQRMDPSKRAIAPVEDQLLALSIMPGLEKAFPDGEAGGRFAISPRSNPETPKTEAGAKQEDILEDNSSPAANPIDGKPEVETDTGTGEDPFVVFTNTGAGSKFNEDSSGPGEEIFEGVTIGAGRYEPRDELNIKRSESEDDSIADISIAGATWEPGNNPDHDLVIHTPQPLQTFYDLYIISTDKSGGVLPDYFGFFRNTQIYTGFLDMRQSEDEKDPPWTVQFGLPEEAETESILVVDEEHKQKGFRPPFPKEKNTTQFP